MHSDDHHPRAVNPTFPPFLRLALSILRTITGNRVARFRFSFPFSRESLGIGGTLLEGISVVVEELRG